MNYLLSFTNNRKKGTEEKKLECSFKVKWFLIKTSLTPEIHADHLQCKMLSFPFFFFQLGLVTFALHSDQFLGRKKDVRIVLTKGKTLDNLPSKYLINNYESSTWNSPQRVWNSLFFHRFKRNIQTGEWPQNRNKLCIRQFLETR